MLTEEQFQEKRKEILLKVRQEELKDDAKAHFDHFILKEKLKFCTPLQKLYEKIFFDDLDLGAELAKFDIYSDGTVSVKDFRATILKEVLSIETT